MDEREHDPERQGYGHLRRGPSSFWMHDPDTVFDALALRQGDVFLDLGCGPGDYAMRAARIVGESGVVHAIEKWSYMVRGLNQEAEAQGLSNIKPLAADMTDPLPMEAESIDVVLLATVLHIYHLPHIEKGLFKEIHRVLKPWGRVAIIECKKEDQPFGPPKHMRLSASELEASFMKYGFETIGFTDLGLNYMVQFKIGLVE